MYAFVGGTRSSRRIDSNKTIRIGEKHYIYLPGISFFYVPALPLFSCLYVVFVSLDPMSYVAQAAIRHVISKMFLVSFCLHMLTTKISCILHCMRYDDLLPEIWGFYPTGAWSRGCHCQTRESPTHPNILGRGIEL